MNDETDPEQEGNMEQLCTGRTSSGAWCMRIEGHSGLHAVEPEKLEMCCARVGNGAWCTLHENHSGDHRSDTEPVYGPVRDAYKKFKMQPRCVEFGIGWHDYAPSLGVITLPAVKK